MTTPIERIAWAFEDTINYDPEGREAIAKAFHDLNCHCDPYGYDPPVGGMSMYQRRADDFIAVLRDNLGY